MPRSQRIFKKRKFVGKRKPEQESNATLPSNPEESTSRKKVKRETDKNNQPLKINGEQKISIPDAEISSENKTNFVFSNHPNLEDIRKLQAEFVRDRNWEQYHTPRNLLLALVGEVGELSELFQWRGEVKSGLPDWTPEDKEHLGQELSDVMIYLIRLSERCGIDLPAAVIKKIALNSKKYPASKVWGSDKKYTEYKNDL